MTDRDRTAGSPPRCAVCDNPIPDEYDKFDDEAPVYADDYVVHLGCEDELFDWFVEAGDG